MNILVRPLAMGPQGAFFLAINGGDDIRFGDYEVSGGDTFHAVLRDLSELLILLEYSLKRMFARGNEPGVYYCCTLSNGCRAK